MSGKRSLSSAILALALAAPITAQDMIAVSWFGDTFLVDSSDAQTTPLGSTGVLGNNSMAVHPDGTVFVAAQFHGPVLVFVDPETGNTFAGAALGLDDVRALAYRATSGLLYAIVNEPIGVSSAIDQLWTIDPRTNPPQTSFVGETGATAIQGLAFHPNGTLYGYDVPCCPGSTDMGLVVLDTLTGVACDPLPVTGPQGSHQFLAISESGTIFAGRDELFVVDPFTGTETLVGSMGPNANIRGLDFRRNGPGDPLGVSFCTPAVPNSTGLPGTIQARGNPVAVFDHVTLEASQLPAQQFALFLNSMLQDFVANPGGSQGNLCLGGQIGRHVEQVGGTGAAGTFAIELDLFALPRPSGPTTVVAGQTWNFQCWYRDVGNRSNFTDAVSVTFR